MPSAQGGSSRSLKGVKRTDPQNPHQSYQYKTGWGCTLCQLAGARSIKDQSGAKGADAGVQNGADPEWPRDA
jgi:hypothetical protein